MIPLNELKPGYYWARYNRKPRDSDFEAKYPVFGEVVFIVIGGVYPFLSANMYGTWATINPGNYDFLEKVMKPRNTDEMV